MGRKEIDRVIAMALFDDSIKTLLLDPTSREALLQHIRKSFIDVPLTNQDIKELISIHESQDLQAFTQEFEERYPQTDLD